ncbi:hypothetical protein [Lewinella sp. IMCC34183]|uniref:AbiTii domain-containing protein n=1 Tax=Lewinella sp. IMCC34183 TaxID=2248762 RepID=UPI001300A220|nr:hypothetical protein [Lewinella sp. IMCC34183]
MNVSETNINQIIQDLINESSSLDNILRSTKVLAYQLKNENLKQWAEAELSGYTIGTEVPNYRQIVCEVRGDLIQESYTRVLQQRDQKLPTESLSDQKRILLTHHTTHESIAELESHTNHSSGSGHLIMALPYQFTSFFDNIILNYSIERMYKVFTISQIVGIMSKIKSQLLTFLLELNEELGYGEVNLSAKSNDIDNVFRKTIGSISGRNISLTFGNENIISNSSDNAQTKNVINQVSASDHDLKLQLNEIINTFNEIQKTNDIELSREVTLEVDRLSIQSEKSNPDRNIVAQSIDILKSMTTSILANGVTDPVFIGLNNLINVVKQGL